LAQAVVNTLRTPHVSSLTYVNGARAKVPSAYDQAFEAEG